MVSLFLACLPTPRSTCKCFGYNLLKGGAPWRSWKQLGVSSGAENYLYQHLHLPSVVCVFTGRFMLDSYPSFLIIFASACGCVTGSNQWNVKGALYVSSRLTLFIMDVLSLCSLLSPAPSWKSTSVVTLRVLCQYWLIFCQLRFPHDHMEQMILAHPLLFQK